MTKQVHCSLSTGEQIVARVPDHWDEPIPWVHMDALLQIAPGHFVMGHLVTEIVYKGE